MELIETHTGVQTEVEDAADIVFPSGKSKLKASSPSPSRKKRSRNVAKGDYGVTMVCPSKAGSPPESHRTPLQTGLSKLVDASVRFHPDKDRVLKQGFAGQALTPPELREMLRRLFRIKLTEPELSALFAYFAPDGGMELDGSMFIILFIKMGQTERDRQRAEHREAERLYMNQRARESAGGQRRSTIHEGSPDDKAAGVKWGEMLEGDCPQSSRLTTCRVARAALAGCPAFLVLLFHGGGPPTTRVRAQCNGLLRRRSLHQRSSGQRDVLIEGL